MNHERDKASDTHAPANFVSPMANSGAVPRRGHVVRSPPTSPHSAYPPASAYFPLMSSSGDDVPEPTPDAATHFAYSTTLRRHRSDSFEGQNLWQKAFNAVQVATGQSTKADDSQRKNRRSLDIPLSTKAQSTTASARYAHCTIEATLREFGVSQEEGLSVSSIQNLRSTYGYNEFSVSSPESIWVKFAKNIYENPLILLLCASALVSTFMGNLDDAISITIAVLIVVTVGFVQERRSEKSLEELNKLVPHHCHVVRDRQNVHVLANELVPGDIVTFHAGDRIPADIRIISAVELEIDESSLTGETFARSKSIEPCPWQGDAPAAMAERTCIAYMGTLVRNGRGSGVVVATGRDTEFGVIFDMMQDVEEKRTLLQLSMDELAKKLSILSFGIIAVIILIGLLQKRSWLDMFTIGVSLAVAAIPEGLPIVTTVTLALGVLRMAKRKAIVKKLHSVEALGSVSVICSDKTGTLTRNEQTVTQVYTVDEIIHIDLSVSPCFSKPLSLPLRKALNIGALCNNAARNESGEFVGDSTEIALLDVLEYFEVPDPRTTFTRLGERPFNSENKFMAVSGVSSAEAHMQSTSGAGGPSVNGAPREIYYMKGSIEAVLGRCKFYYVSENSTPSLDAAAQSVVQSMALKAAASGLRVIAMAYGYGSVNDSASDTFSQSAASRGASSPPKDNLIFVGFQAMLDPPRRGVADAIALLQSGGVQVVMITGDAEETALSIAKSIGLRVGRGNDAGEGQRSYVLTGQAIDQMSQTQLKERVGTVSVFARTTPRHKMAIVEAFQSRGAVVAMTGDGVNDAPALKMADIGVSMGKSGTDVAKEAGNVILVDDNFSTILPAIEEGKSIFHNIQNFLAFQLSTAAAALTLITLSTMFGLSNPLNAMQILFINILMDGPPSQSLGVDPVDPAVMRKPPRKKDEPIITKWLLYRVLFSASIIVVGTLSVYMFALSDDHMSRREQTMTFTCFVFLDLVSAVQNRGLGCELGQNKMLLTTVSVSFVVQLMLIYAPILQAVFQTEALERNDLMILLLLGGISMALHEGRRRYERRVHGSVTYASVVEEMA